MADAELNVALTILRIIRGWTQDDLGKASGIPNSSISDYERGKKVPGLRSLERLTAAMGFTVASLQRTTRFIQAVRSEAFLELERDWPPAAPQPGETLAEPVIGTATPAALDWELEQISAEAGRVVARLSRVVLVMMNRASRPFPPETGDAS
jgi:transcriptional regulator with XRE-family HTH domain